MRSLATTYQDIADILSFESDTQDLERRLSAATFNWDAIVVHGSQHLVLPAIYCRLQSKQLLQVLPPELNSYLEELTSINRNRNKVLLSQIHSISELLNQHEIRHVFLKGAALLALGCYNDNAERMVGDIDILVDKSQLHEAFQLLQQNGYNKTYGFSYTNTGFRHLDRLISDDHLAAVELHDNLLEPQYRHLIDVSAVLKTKVYAGQIPIPNTYDLCYHQILGYQLNDLGFYHKTLHFKYVYDSLVLGVHSQERLLKTLLNSPIGQAYLAVSQCYFKEFSSLRPTPAMLGYQKSHQNYLHHPFYKTVLKPLKQGYLDTQHRLRLLIFNPSYRQHALKKIFLKEK